MRRIKIMLGAYEPNKSYTRRRVSRNHAVGNQRLVAVGCGGDMRAVARHAVKPRATALSFLLDILIFCGILNP